ncbi:hypothetical protein AJ80_07401 [Polytolypa hystricis UAMH7299]|uniref:Uncharacterized protein n=1 Tax=Polytolypa hystricis (strain UAMH7299) TaxID=1447883 RepID=A0A2B7XPN6_POLH7|nr:hypothetical protein AJ80_07401 [Polytolypa hystricis UAMH7299]
MEYESFHPILLATRNKNGTDRADWASESLVDTLFRTINFQNRTSIAVTAAFSVLASTLVALSIVYDTWRAHKRAYRPKKSRRFEFFRHIPPGHIFPSVLVGATFVQSTIFLAVQSTGLQKLFVTGCKATSQITWIGAWIVGYTLLVFSSEATFRSLRPSRFQSRGKWNTLICWAVVLAMLVLTWIPAIVRQRRRNICIGSLLLWIAPWSRVAAVITPVLILFYIINGSILTYRLSRNAKLDHRDRIAASSIVYYLAATILIFPFAMPFWLNAGFSRHPTSDVLQLMGSIALNLFGLVYAFVYLLLRAKGVNMMIGPGMSNWVARPWRRLDPTAVAMAEQINKPIVPNQKGFNSLDDGRVQDFDIPRDGRRDSLSWMDEKTPTTGQSSLGLTRSPTALSSSARKRSNYSIFPVRASSRNTRRFVLNLNDSHEGLMPPRPVVTRHKRFSSNISAATVQIGLRLSNIAMPLNAATLGLPSSPNQGVPRSESKFTNSTTPTTLSSSNSRVLLKSPSEHTNTTASQTRSPNSKNLSPSRFLPSQGMGPDGLKPPPGAIGGSVCTNKVLPPTPLLVPSKRDTTAPPVPSLPQAIKSTLPASPKLENSWPLPERISQLPERLSRLPNKSYSRPDQWI